MLSRLELRCTGCTSAAKRMDARERPFVAFDAADVAAVEACEFGEGFLGPAAGSAGSAENADTPGEEAAGGVGFGGHGKVVADGEPEGA